jgi:hypothetical protein
MKVGINTFKALKDGRILIEAGSKEEIERIRDSINEIGSAVNDFNCGRDFVWCFFKCRRF